MGISRLDVFSSSQNQLAALAKALGHPARIAILQIIIKSKACLCADMVTEIGLAQATISQHIKELKNIGLLKSSHINGRMCYCIDPEGWSTLKKEIGNFINIEFSDSCC